MEVKINLPEAIELYKTGISVFELAKKYNTTSITMKLRLIKAGVKVRSASEQKKITMNKPEILLKI